MDHDKMPDNEYCAMIVAAAVRAGAEVKFVRPDGATLSISSRGVCSVAPARRLRAGVKVK